MLHLFLEKSKELTSLVRVKLRNYHLSVFLTNFLITSLCLISLFYYVFLKNLNINEQQILEIQTGDSISQTITNLKNKKIISSFIPHKELLVLSNKLITDFTFKSGEYLITAEDNFLSLINKFNNHEVFLRQLQIIEGDTINDAINIIKNNPYLTGEITITLKEGSILPDTYYFEKYTDRNNLIEIMQKKMQESLDSLWSNLTDNTNNLTKEDFLVLASIIEKETGLKAERQEISGVFHNRLKKKMRLQSDPTVIYAITKGKFKLKKPLSKKNLKQYSEYNTYRISGLPPTPIANPGYQSLYASFNPNKTNNLYFVSDNNGGHNFATNLKDHNKNVRILRKLEKERNAK